MIGQSNHVGFAFTTLNQIPLYLTYCFVLQLAFSCAPRGLLVRVCEGGTRVISCSVTKRINILFANYGRIAGGHICPGPIQTNNCGAARSLAIVRNDCQGRLRCTLVANNNKFGDPCPGTRKYLEVRTFRQAVKGNNNNNNLYTGSPHHQGDIQWGPVD